jgi:hypothetical protein
MEPFGYVLLGIAICLTAIFALYWISFYYLDWYNRVCLPNRPPEFITDLDGNVSEVIWYYNTSKKVAERQIRRISAPPTTPPPTRDYPTYDDKGNLR